VATPLSRVQDAIAPSSPQLPSFAFPWENSKELAMCAHTHTHSRLMSNGPTAITEGGLLFEKSGH
jgi:hypothetical protein